MWLIRTMYQALVVFVRKLRCRDVDVDVGLTVFETMMLWGENRATFGSIITTVDQTVNKAVNQAVSGVGYWVLHAAMDRTVNGAVGGAVYAAVYTAKRQDPPHPHLAEFMLEECYGS
jgi:hypothetical protein